MKKRDALIIALGIIFIQIISVISIVIMVVTMVFGIALWNTVRQENNSVNRSDRQQAIHDLYESKVYEGISLYGVFEKKEQIEISFKYKSNIDISEIDEIKEVLSAYIDNQGEEQMEDEKIIITFFSYSNDPGDWCAISNFVENDKFSEIEEYADDQNVWWLYCMKFDNWSELENNFSYVEGVCRCYIREFGDISDIDPTKWDSLKYIHILYYGDDAEYYEQELHNLFPDAEVHVGAEIDW